MSQSEGLEELRKKAGIGRVTIQRLQRAGLDNPRVLAVMNPEEIEEYAGIDVIRAGKIIRAARAIVGLDSEPILAERLEVEDTTPRLTTGVRGFDELLGGGLRSGDIYEFIGEFGAGKTQLCHQLAVTVQLPPEMGGVGGKALYIDTEGTFSPGRIESIAERFGVEKPLEGVFTYRAESVIALEDLVVKRLPRFIEEKNVKLVIIDSVIALYRAQFKGREYLARRQQRLNYLLDWLKRLGRVYSPLYIVITNQVLTSPTPFGAMKLPAGGNILAHASTHRFYLRKGRESHVLTVLDSPSLPRDAKVEFVITDGGVEDA